MKNKIDRQLVWQKYGGKCAYCGEQITVKDMQVDHIIPQWNFENMVKKQGFIPSFLTNLTVDDLNHIDNLNPSCRVCNKWKSGNPLEVFRNELTSQIKRLNEYSSNYRIAKKYGLIEEKPTQIKFYFETLD